MMVDDRNTLLAFQQEVLDAMRRIFLTNWATMTQMQDRMEGLVRLLVEQRMESYKVALKFMEWWVADFQRARQGFQQAVDRVFLSGRKTLEKAKRESGTRAAVKTASPEAVSQQHGAAKKGSGKKGPATKGAAKKRTAKRGSPKKTRKK
jgi:hypothetical protein